jgi:hypothetical protein
MVEGSKTDYTMHHSSYLYFIDRQGMQRALMPFGRPAADIAHDLALLLEAVMEAPATPSRACRWCRCASALALLAWAAWRRSAAAATLFEIPKGTWARRMAGDKVEILPSDVTPDAGREGRAPAAQQRHRAAGVRPGADHAGPGLPPAVRDASRKPVRLHRARQRADDGVVEPLSQPGPGAPALALALLAHDSPITGKGR